MAVAFTQNDYVLRIYDGTAVTPNYIEVLLYEFHELPLRAPRATQTNQAGGGKVTPGNVISFVQNEVSIMEPQPFSLTFNLDPDRVWQYDAFGNPRDLGTWNVGSTPTLWAPIPVANLGTRNNARGVAVSVPAPADTDSVNSLFSMEFLLSTPPGAVGTDVFGAKYNAIRLVNARKAIQDGPGQWTVDLENIGGIDQTITAFTTGTETT